mgnify:CR=1 FL=1
MYIFYFHQIDNLQIVSEDEPKMSFRLSFFNFEKNDRELAREKRSAPLFFANIFDDYFVNRNLEHSLQDNGHASPLSGGGT